MIEIIRPGPLATVQDLGRPGHAALGVGRSGAADRRSLRHANLLVGNAEHAAAIEATFGGLVARFDVAATIAVTGAPCQVSLDQVRAPMDEPLEVPAGATLRFGVPRRGLRTYVGVRGGVDVPPVLGSRSTDLMSGLGPAALTAGSRLPIGTAATGKPTTSPSEPIAENLLLRVLPGPRGDWFVPDALEILYAGPYTVMTESNRVGLRLDGPALPRRRYDELPPEGMVEGAIQVPPDGRPVLLLADHPVTGGYPVLAVVADEDISLAGQARPGQRIRLRPSSIAHPA